MRDHDWKRVSGKGWSCDQCRRCGIAANYMFDELCHVTWNPEALRLPGDEAQDDCDYELVRSVMLS